MMIRFALIWLFAGLVPFNAIAQVIDNTLSHKNISDDSYFRVNYENDFFSATDIYYTQGIHVEIVDKWIQHFPLTRLLMHSLRGYTRYGLAAEHDGYTPTSISSDAILYGDRPFAACLFLKTFVITTDTVKRQRFSTTLSTGIIGQAAGGMEMQTGIHRWLHDITPHGWQYQIHNDAVVNYQADCEKQLVAYRNIFLLDAGGMARAGTLSDKLAAGATIIVGCFELPYAARQTGRRLHVYTYERPVINVAGYDATLQGGLFNKTSPYTINAADMTRVTFENRFGVVISYRKLYLEYFQSYLSREFKTGNYHVWGGVQIAAGF
jgi:lipid A 3-O-deacylase